MVSSLKHPWLAHFDPKLKEDEHYENDSSNCKTR